MLLLIATSILLVSMTLVLIRSIIGPTLYDRILAANSFGTYTVVVILLLGYLFDTPFFLDVAMIYALINFIATIAFLRYFKLGSFQSKQTVGK